MIRRAAVRVSPFRTHVNLMSTQSGMFLFPGMGSCTTNGHESTRRRGVFCRRVGRGVSLRAHRSGPSAEGVGSCGERRASRHFPRDPGFCAHLRDFPANDACCEADREWLTGHRGRLRGNIFAAPFRAIPGRSEQARSDFSAGAGIVRTSAGSSVSWPAIVGKGAWTGRRAQRSGRGFPVVRPLRTHGEPRKTPCLVFRVS